MPAHPQPAEHAPEKWAAFKEYNRRDVGAEMPFRSGFPGSGAGCRLEEYQLDQEINDRGVLLTQTLVRNAVLCRARSREN
jgi:DNA polymerase